MAQKSRMADLLRMVEKTKPASTDIESLPKHDRTRIRRLQKYVQKLDDGFDVQNRDILSVLTEEQYSAMQAEWERERQGRAAGKPEEIKKYEERLRQALFAYNKGDFYSRSGKHDSARQFIHDAERLFEWLLEYQAEVISKDYSLALWFDRQGGGLDPASIPRIVTSRSDFKEGHEKSGVGQQTKRDVKRNALVAALGEYGIE